MSVARDSFGLKIALFLLGFFLVLMVYAFGLYRFQGDLRLVLWVYLQNTCWLYPM